MTTVSGAELGPDAGPLACCPFLLTITYYFIAHLFNSLDYVPSSVLSKDKTMTKTNSSSLRHEESQGQKIIIIILIIIAGSVLIVTHWLTFIQHLTINKALSHPASYFILPTNP